jgi:hypothetical protein
VGGTPSTSLDVVVDILGLHPPTAGDGSPLLGMVRSGGRPRFLVPLDTWRAAGASCLAYNRLREPRTRLQRGVLGAGLRVGAGRAVAGERFAVDAGPDSLLAHMRNVLGDQRLCLAVGLGSLDTVWKPTLQVLRHDGRPLAYVKVGWTEFPTDLVENEAATLSLWDAHRGRGPVTPRLLSRSEWRGLTLVAVSPLPVDVRRIGDDTTTPSPAPVRALDGDAVPEQLGSTTWWKTLAESVTAGADHPADGHLTAALDAAAVRFADHVVPTARWHGDWTPWNLAQSPSRGLVAWDWEYSAPGAPVGLDEVHSSFQVARLLGGHTAAGSFDRSASDADPLLAAVQPLMAAERVQRAVRAGCPLDPGGAELLAAAPGAVHGACAR